MKIVLPVLFAVLLVPALYGQPDLGYYLPEGISYDPSIPTPRAVIGHEVGEWHVTHDRLVQYMYALDKASDRISLAVTGYTHEDRPLLLLTITSPANHANLEDLRRQHVQLTDPATSASLDTKNMPAVFYMGFSVHGNEASGVNAALLVAYHLAAAQGKEMQDYLAHTIIVFDPCYNPDGMQRFSSWVNSRKSKVISVDPNDTEHHEAWPGGRFNHYWFDLNRDWLVAQHPESQARLKSFHHWKPNVLTDHHEMGTNETFFFQPGVPSRNHPLTPPKNFELTKRIAVFHAQALDAIGSFYFTQKEFDDFYYGKGSTFPDVQGAIGILFEQGSARGHAQESVNGVLRFEFAVRNQFTTALSSLKAVNALREELLNYQRQFFKDAVAEAAKDPVKAIIFGAGKDKASAYHLAEVMLRQDIVVHAVTAAQKINGRTVESAFVVPMNQPQYKLIKGMFERRTQFRDSIFYDISGWTLPLAFGVDYEELKIAPAAGQKITALSFPSGERVGGKSEYAYAFESNGFYAPRALYRLLKQGLRVKVATDPFQHPDGKKFDRGTILLPVAGQDRNPEQIEYLLQEIATQDGIDVYAFNSGLDFNGSSLGSRSFVTLKKPEIAILTGDGISASPAGEMWHLLDTRFNIPVTLLPLDVFSRTSLGRYTTIILPPLYSSININDAGKEKLKAWVQGGGVLIGFENSLSWLSGCGFGKFEMKKKKDGDNAAGAKDDEPRAYAHIDEYTDAQVTSGAIFEVAVDLTHPLLYGYDHPRMAVFRSHNLFMEKAKNAYGNPLVFTSAPLLSGYISKANYGKLKETAAAGASAMGQGRVIGFTENLCFRGFWFGTNKLLMNAIFYGSLISTASCR